MALRAAFTPLFGEHEPEKRTPVFQKDHAPAK